MTISIIEKRLATYESKTHEEEQQAIKEILQEVILFSLSSSGFFRDAIFHGGTSLRILYELPRFSEDLDFMLIEPNANFRWQPYLESIISTCKQFGVHPEVHDRSKVDKTIQRMFLKDNSIGKILDLGFHHHPDKKLMIKLEIDTNPPLGSELETQFLDFPLDFSIACQDMASNFAGKCHALLCREYIKGRDWFDFSWYVANETTPNLSFLSSAIQQQGPWKGEAQKVDESWLLSALNEKINAINWQTAANEVRPFLRQPYSESTNLWGKAFFLSKLNKLKQQFANTHQ